MQATNDAGPSRPPRLHSSVESHLSTELTLLQALEHRSKDQHKGQIFYRRISEILRLGKRVQDVVPSIRDGSQSDGLLRSILIKFISALVKAANSTEQIIALRHFLPLEISLLGIYSRLFTIVNNIAAAVGMDTQSLISGKGVKGPKVFETGRESEQPPMDLDLDLGQRMQRPSASISRPHSITSSRLGSQMDDSNEISQANHGPSSPTFPPETTSPPDKEIAPSLKRRTDDTRPAKSKKKRNVMDDIFG